MGNEDREVVVELGSAVALLILAFIAIFLGYFSFLLEAVIATVTNEKPEIWFQRSGAIVVLLAVFSEYCLSKIDGYINPTGLIVSRQEEFSAKYSTVYRVVKVFGVVMAIIGTLIWGYGDLAWLWINT